MLLKKIILWSGLILMWLNACAKVEIEITEGRAQHITLAINQVLNEPRQQRTLTQIIAHDLSLSGIIQIIHRNFKNIDQAAFKELRSANIEVLFDAHCALVDQQYQLTVTLTDVYRQHKILNKVFTFKLNQLDALAHHISDLIYQQFTGTRGNFATKLAFVHVEELRRAHHKNGVPARLCRYSLCLTDSDGKNIQTLLTSIAPIMSLSWSPNGKELAYVSFENHRAAIYLQNLATGKRELLAKYPGINGAPAWSPDGKRLALVLTTSGAPKIYLLDLANKKLQQLTKGWSLDTEPSWAPDGHSLLFTSNRGGTPQIYRYYLADARIERVTFTGSYNARASFLPNQKAIIMLHKEADLFTIARQELITGQILLLSPTGFNEAPSIAPNGQMIVYATNRKRSGTLAITSIDGKFKQRLLQVNGEIREPVWSPFLAK